MTLLELLLTSVTLTSRHLVIVGFLSKLKVSPADAPVPGIPVDERRALQPGHTSPPSTGHHHLLLTVLGPIYDWMLVQRIMGGSRAKGRGGVVIC